MISEDPKFIFVGPQKTGSTSVVKSLLPYCKIVRKIEQRKENFDVKFVIGADGVLGDKHTPLARYFKEFKKSNLDIESYFKIATVRNPFSRLVSYYNWKSKVHSKFNFDEIQHWGRIKPLVKYISYEDKVRTDFLIKTENLTEDFERLCNILKISPEPIDHINKTKEVDYTKYYNNKTRKYVEEFYSDDLKMLGYKFGD
jgi:hypothetical protein